MDYRVLFTPAFITAVVIIIIISFAIAAYQNYPPKVKKQRDTEYRRLKDAAQRLKAAYQNLTKEERDQLLKDPITTLDPVVREEYGVSVTEVASLVTGRIEKVLRTVAQSHVLTVAKVSVAYRFNFFSNPTPENIANVDQKLTEILKANPDADLTKFQDPLRIVILHVERPPAPPPPPRSPRNLLGRDVE